MATPSLGATQEALVADVEDVELVLYVWLRTDEILCATLCCILLAGYAEFGEQRIDLTCRSACVEVNLNVSQCLCQISIVLGSLAKCDGAAHILYGTSISEDNIDLFGKNLGILLNLSSVEVGLQFVLALCGIAKQGVVHGSGQFGITLLCKCDGSLQGISALLIVNLLNVDTAVVELATPVLLDVCGDDVLTNVEILGRDVYLNGVHAIGPSCILLQEVTVNVCLVVIIVANVEGIAQTLVDLVHLEGTAYPEVGVFTTGPDGLWLWIVTAVTNWHLPGLPHLVVEIGQSPCLGLGTSLNLGPLDFVCRICALLLVVVDVRHVEVVEVVRAYPEFLLVRLVEYRHVGNLDGRTSLAASEVEDNLQVLNVNAVHRAFELEVLVGSQINFVFSSNDFVVVVVCQLDAHAGIVARGVESNLEDVVVVFEDVDARLEVHLRAPCLFAILIRFMCCAIHVYGVYVTLLSLVELLPVVQWVWVVVA